MAPHMGQHSTARAHLILYSEPWRTSTKNSRHFSLPHLLISSSTVNNHKTADRVTATISEAPTFQNSISANSSGISISLPIYNLMFLVYQLKFICSLYILLALLTFQLIEMKPTKYVKTPLTMELSDDLIHEILLRLPLKSLGRFKSVCKSWFSLISNPEFAKLHLQFSNLISIINPPLILTLQENNVISLFKYKSCTDIALDRQFVDVFDWGRCFIVGSCDGILCLYIKSKVKFGEDLLHLWNPVTNEDKQISLFGVKGLTYLHVGSAWFGYVPSLRDYKIILVNTSIGDKPGFVKRMYMYSLRDPKWRELDVTDAGSSFASVSNSVFLNEALHCLGQKCIHKFDLVEETFEKVPLLIKPDLPKPHQIKLGVIGEKNCLCAMLVHHSEEEEWMFESWMLEEYNKWDSWKKLYRIDLKKEIARNYIGFLGFTYNGNFCIREKYGLKLIDPSDPPSCVMVCRGSVFVAIDYVESLVSPFSLD